MKTFEIKFTVDVDDENYPNVIDELDNSVNKHLFEIGSLISGTRKIRMTMKEIQKVKREKKVKHDEKSVIK